MSGDALYGSLLGILIGIAIHTGRGAWLRYRERTKHDRRLRKAVRVVEASVAPTSPPPAHSSIAGSITAIAAGYPVSYAVSALPGGRLKREEEK